MIFLKDLLIHKNNNFLFILFYHKKISNKNIIAQKQLNFFRNYFNATIFYKNDLVYIFHFFKILKKLKYLSFYKSIIKKNIKFKFSPLHKNTNLIKIFKTKSTSNNFYVCKNSFYMCKKSSNYSNQNKFFIDALKLKTHKNCSFFFKSYFWQKFKKIGFTFEDMQLMFNFNNYLNNLLIMKTCSKIFFSKHIVLLSTFEKINNFKTRELNFFFSKLMLFYNKTFIVNFKYLNLKNIKINFDTFVSHLMFLEDKNNFYEKKNDLTFLSNKYLANFFSFSDSNNFFPFNFFLKQNSLCYNNYYPIFLSSKRSYKTFFSNYKTNYNIDFIVFTNRFVINFIEKFSKKFVFIKYKNNFYNSAENRFLDNILSDYKKFQPAFWKKFLVKDFISILWYSFFLKDLTMISNWISIFMETLNFKNHKKFVNFFLNFTIKYADVFVNVLKIKGFFFDIRGKVGVTGSSKKRHIFFRFGSLKKSSKKTKINFNQNLVRTYSGVMGLTYIISY